ncbi:hypothetical protein B0H11DRAFT_1992981 [Mycena galericulata]|nr:hypothetical protein B0H11DRAFT_1992981 [Mycena galericulata]
MATTGRNHKLLKRCFICSTTESPAWRLGHSPSTNGQHLCNRCGLRESGTKHRRQRAREERTKLGPDPMITGICGLVASLHPTAMTQWNCFQVTDEPGVDEPGSAIGVPSADSEEFFSPGSASQDVHTNPPYPVPSTIEACEAIFSPGTGGLGASAHPTSHPAGLRAQPDIQESGTQVGARGFKSIGGAEIPPFGSFPFKIARWEGPHPQLPSYTSSEITYGRFLGRLESELALSRPGELYAATASFVLEEQGQTQMRLFFAMQKEFTMTPRVNPRPTSELNIFSFSRALVSGVAPQSSIPWINIQSVAQELPADVRTHAWNIARLARSSGYEFTSLRAVRQSSASNIVVLSPGSSEHFLTPNQEIEICLDLKYNRPYITDIVRTRSQELWTAFFRIVKDWYTALQSALFTVKTRQQFVMIDIYETYMFQLGESEEYGAVQADQRSCLSAGVDYSEITRLWKAGVKVYMDSLRAQVPMAVLSRPPENGYMAASDVLALA